MTETNQELGGVSNNNNNSSSGGSPLLLSYDTQNMTHRSAQEEWQPHRHQTTTSWEWWYITALLHDAAGTQYMLFDTYYKYDGKDNPAVKNLPELAAKMGPNTTLISRNLVLSNYDTGFSYSDIDYATMDVNKLWDPNTSTVFYVSSNYNTSWSFDGENMTAILKSQNLSYNLNMKGGEQVMWAKDSVYDKEGFIQEGLPGNVSFYYSLPRLVVWGNITYVDESGTNKTIDVVGQGWVDRQWGDFNTEAWEWASFRFDNGARVNLYNFANGHQVGTYQKSDGSTQWFGNFTVKQNGYAKEPESGQWVSFGWSYDFPIDIEGSKHYTVTPFSTQDLIYLRADKMGFFEGTGRLVDDTNGKHVGTSINESTDIRLMRNGPYDINQH